jgi:hypothetical protein
MDNIIEQQEVVLETTQNASEQIHQTPQLNPSQIEEIQKKSFGHAFGLVDNKLAELGYVKPDGVKTTDYIVELLTKNKNVTTDGTKTTTKVVDDSELGTKVKELQTLLRSKEEELEQVKTSVTSQKRDYWLDSLVNSTPITAPDHLSEQEKSRMMSRTKNLIKSELLQNYDVKEVDNQFRFYKKDGSPVLDGTIDMNPIEPRALIEREFSEFIKLKNSTPQQVKGTGTVKDDSNVANVERVIPSKVKNASEYYTYLREDLKLTMGSKEFMEKIDLAKKERPAMFS